VGVSAGTESGMTWQPIEPAGISVAEYVSHNNAGTEKAWYLPDYYCYDTSYEATHWMPLPSPPEEAA
jgi:hypothetical protein